MSASQAAQQLDQARKEGGEAKYQQTLAAIGGDPYARAQEMTRPKDVETNAAVKAARSNMKAVRREVLSRQPESDRAARFQMMSTLLSNRAAVSAANARRANARRANARCV